jgi:PhnB protein
MKTYKPDGYNDLSAYLVADDAPRLIEFLEEAFGGQLQRRYDRPDGGIMHAEVRIGDSVIMLGDSTEAAPARTATLHLYVPDAQAVYEAALAAGATSVEAPAQHEGDPDLRGSFEDPFGNYWAVGTQVEG